MKSKKLKINLLCLLCILIFTSCAEKLNIIISRKSGQKIQKIANLQYYKSKANYGTKKKGISR